jgi:hypothetical protein
VAEPRNHVWMKADVNAAPDAVFTFLTEHFGELWPGKLERVSDGSDPSEPLGLGFVRDIKTPAMTLREEIVTHERPRLIEYKVINPDEARMYNHLGRIELAPDGANGTRINYTVDFDFRPAALGPVAAAGLKGLWNTQAKRKLRSTFP